MKHYISHDIRFIEDDEYLKASVLKLIDIIVLEKTLTLPANVYMLDANLISNNIIKLEDNDYEIQNLEVVSFYLLEKFKFMYGYAVTNNFNENVGFLLKIKRYFEINGRGKRYRLIEEILYRFVIFESNINCGCTFNEYLSSLKPKDDTGSSFGFVQAYSAELPNLIIPVDVFYQNLLLLLEITKSDADYNIPLSSVLNGLKQKCKHDTQLGLSLFEFAMKQPEQIDNIISAIVSGLYEQKRGEFYDTVLKNYIERRKCLNAILFGLSYVEEIGDFEYDLFIKLFDWFVNGETSNASLLSLLIAVLRKADIATDENFIMQVFARINELIKDENIPNLVLCHLAYLDNYAVEKTDVLLTLIQQSYYKNEKYLKAIDRVLCNITGINSFRKVILALIDHKPFENISKSINCPLASMNRNCLDQFIVELLIDLKASKRYVGIGFFDYLSSITPYRFSVNIIELEPISQYKLWVSLMQGYKEPKYRIPALLPLLNSTSSFVKESFICKLEECSEDYAGHIVKVLKLNLDQSNVEHECIIRRVEKYVEQYFAANVEIKSDIKELNPYYTSYSNLKRFNELLNKKMSLNVRKGTEENSLISILGLNTVQLSKGGGWKFGGKKERLNLGFKWKG